LLYSGHAISGFGAQKRCSDEETGEKPAVIKVVAIGDVHGQWAELWSILKAAAVCDHNYEPTPAVVEGRYQVVCLGDLVHYKDERAYEQAAGVEPYDPVCPEHLRRAAKAQIRELYRFRTFVAKAAGNITVILGNHDEAAVTQQYDLGTRGGLRHNEFNEDLGGLALPADLQEWFGSFARSTVFHGVHFAHAGPLPGMQSFDDFFYHDSDTKTWWYKKPELVRQTGHRFGVYGHTVMKEGIYLDERHGLAMIDALAHKQFLEILLDHDRLDYRVMQL
jgi:ADP-ribose pyrophosphatase YjhB (NUDIX family)